jgi:hypothetical protein
MTKFKSICTVGEFYDKLLYLTGFNNKIQRDITKIKLYDEGFLFEIKDIVYSKEDNVVAITLNGVQEFTENSIPEYKKDDEKSLQSCPLGDDAGDCIDCIHGDEESSSCNLKEKEAKP